MAGTDETEPESRQYDLNSGIYGELRANAKKIDCVDGKVDRLLDIVLGPKLDNPGDKRVSRLGLLHITLSTRKLVVGMFAVTIASVWLKGG